MLGRLLLFFRKRGLHSAIAELFNRFVFLFASHLSKRPRDLVINEQVTALAHISATAFWHKTRTKEPVGNLAVPFVLINPEVDPAILSLLIDHLNSQGPYVLYIPSSLNYKNHTTLLPFSTIDTIPHDRLVTLDGFVLPDISGVQKLLKASALSKSVIHYADTIDAETNQPILRPDWGPHSFMQELFTGSCLVVERSHLNASWSPDEGSSHKFWAQLLGSAKDVPSHHEVIIGQETKTVHSGKNWNKEAMLALHVSGSSSTYSSIDLPRPSLNKNAHISIIIPTKNNTAILDRCLESILNTPCSLSYEIILVNNNSDEPSFNSLITKYLNRLSNRFVVVDAPIPFNFSTLINLGASKASGTHLLIMNNDMEVLSEGWMENLLAFAQLPFSGVVGAKLLYPDKRIQHAGMILCNHFGFARHVFWRMPETATVYHQTLLKVRNYSALTAACIMVKKSVFEDVGGFDESFAVEFNDVDFCLRVQSKGLYNVLLPHVVLLHYESISRGHPHQSKEKLERSRKETLLFESRWKHIIAKDPHWHPDLVRHPLLLTE